MMNQSRLADHPLTIVRKPECSVYFIRAGEGGPIKIGIAKDVRARLNTLQVASHQKLTLLHSERGMNRVIKYIANALQTVLTWFRHPPHNGLCDDCGEPSKERYCPKCLREVRS